LVVVLAVLGWDRMRPPASPTGSVAAPPISEQQAPGAAKGAVEVAEREPASAPAPSTKSAVVPGDGESEAPEGADLSDAFERALRPTQNAQGIVTVTVDTDPPGALIYELDQQIGTSPMKLQLKAGSRKKLLALRNNHQPTRFTVDGSEAVVTVVLPRAAEGSGAATQNPRVPAPPARRKGNRASSTGTKSDRMAAPVEKLFEP
jgi:hypothetical protein